MKSLSPHASRHELFRMGSVALLTAAALAPSALYAQGTTASLGGTVTDATGAVIPNATVQLKNEHTGDVRNSTSNGSGIFSFAAVPTGDYDITIKAQGFSNFQQNAIHLDPGDQRTVRDVHLAVGATDQTVTVTTGNQQINIDSGEQSSLISAEDIQHLSVEGRDVTELFKILPGFAINTGVGAGATNNRAFDPSQVSVTGALGQYAASGTPINGVALLSDGADITDPGNFGGAMQTVNYEQVSEVKIQTSSFGADTARGPIVVNAVGKSGGDKYHGSLYTFARTYQLDSNDWIQNHFGEGRPPDHEVYPGGTFGGPVKIPGTGFNGNHKLTFFVGAEDYGQKNVYAYGNASSALLQALVPTAGMRAGDFSYGQLVSYLGPLAPASAAVAASGNPNCGIAANVCSVPQTAPDGTPLTNGNIAAYLDPMSSLIVNRLPLPNVTNTTGTYNYQQDNLVSNDLWQAKGRFDYAINDNNKVFGVYSTQRGSYGVPQSEYYSERGTFLGGTNVPGGGEIANIDSQIASLNWTSVLSPTLTNELYAAGAYLNNPFNAKNLAGTQGYTYGRIFAEPGDTVQPTTEDYNFDGLPLARTPDFSFGAIYAEKVVRTFGDNVTKVLGKHTFRAGIFYQLDTNKQVIPNEQTNGTLNLYYFGGSYTNPGSTATVYNTGYANGNGGNYLADFEEGHVFQFTQANSQPAPNLFFWNLDGYVQDHWRLTPRLTIDAGVRFEHFTPWGDAHGLGIPVFNAASYAARTNPLEPGFAWHAVDPSVSVYGMNQRWAYVEPRGGFAWDAYGTGKTIVRGGFGIYRAHDAFNDADVGEGTVMGLRTVTVGGPISLSAVSAAGGGGTTGTPCAPGVAATFACDASAYGFSQNDTNMPRVRTYNLAVDQRLPGNMQFEIAYVGNVSDYLLNDGASQNGQNTALDDVNSLPVGSLFQPQPVNDRGQIAGTVYPVFPATAGGSTNNTVGGLTQTQIDSFKKYDIYNHVYVQQHNLYANYNGLQTALTKQTGKSVFSFNYTFSKAMGVLGAFNNGYPGDPFNARNDYQEENYSRHHIFNAAYDYNFGSFTKNRLLGYATNGWEISGITTYQSGPPLTAIVNSNFGLSGTLTVPAGFVATPNAGNTSACIVNALPAAQTCTLAINNTNILGTSDVTLQPLVVGQTNAGLTNHHYVNPNAFAIPNFGTNGSYRLGPLHGPGYLDNDLTLAKRFAVTEGSSVQLRLAAFDFINHGNNSFTPQEGSATVLNFTQATASTNSAAALNGLRPANSTSDPAAAFGYAPLREGRRVLEVALRYDF